MAMSDEEKRQYLAEITPKIEAACDRVFTELFGRSYNDEDMKRARLPHGVQNGDGSQHPPDSWARIKADYPDVFG